MVSDTRLQGISFENNLLPRCAWKEEEEHVLLFLFRALRVVPLLNDLIQRYISYVCDLIGPYSVVNSYGTLVM